MSRGAPHPGRRWRMVALALLILALLGVGGLTAFYFLAVPKIAEDTLRARLQRLEERAGVKVHTGTIEPVGLEGLIIRDFKLDDPDGKRALVQVKALHVALDKAKLLTGQKAIESLRAEGVELTVVRRADGTLNLQTVLKNARRPESGSAPQEPAPRGGKTPGWMRYFGGQWPELEVKEITVNLISEREGHPLPLSRVHVPSLSLKRTDDGAALTTSATLTANEVEGWDLPKQAEIKGVARLPLDASELHVTFDKPAQITGVAPLPFLRFTTGAIHVEGKQLKVSQVEVASSLAPEQAQTIFTAKHIGAELTQLTRDLKALRLKAATLDSPTLSLHYAASGASTLSDLSLLVRPPQPARIAARARAVAQAIKLARDPDAKPPLPKPHYGPKSAIPARVMGLVDKASNPITSMAILAMLPQRVEVTNARVLVHDARSFEGLRAARELSLHDGALTLKHTPEQKALQLSASFEPRNGDQKRGSFKASARLSTDTLGFEASLDIPYIDLAWLAQLAGPRLSAKVRGGTLRVKLKATRPARDKPIALDGDVSIDQANLYWARLADAPLDKWSAGLTFKGFYDPKLPTPEPKYIRPPKEDKDKDDDDDEPTEKEKLWIEARTPSPDGALVITEGEARLGAVKAAVKGALYGLDRVKIMPGRVDLSIDLPSTHVQTLFDSVPSALMGDLAGTRMEGFFSWKFRVEIPLYHAAQTEWRTYPKLKDFRLLSLPADMDARKITDAFTHTIRDDDVRFERRVRIPAMRMSPADWIIENTRQDLEKLDKRRRETEWFRPNEDLIPRAELERNPKLLDEPSYWLRPEVLAQRANKPWLVGGFETPVERRWRPFKEDSERRMVAAPYGPYHYVPLHHVSPYIIRAILTTEDHLFFYHSGFNWTSLKRAVASNIRAGEYVRGASTISMQLVKNLFLSRKKVMSRKIQEAFLVWVIEDVLQVPKERLLELYLNIIEFGPGIFGVHDAAVHYFGKRPDELTLGEAIWLVGVVPSPKPYHKYYDKGEIKGKVWWRLRSKLRALKRRERITQEEYDVAYAKPPEFYKPGRLDPPMRPKQITPVMPPTVIDPFAPTAPAHQPTMPDLMP